MKTVFVLFLKPLTRENYYHHTLSQLSHSCVNQLLKMQSHPNKKWKKNSYSEVVELYKHFIAFLAFLPLEKNNTS